MVRAQDALDFYIISYCSDYSVRLSCALEGVEAPHNIWDWKSFKEALVCHFMFFCSCTPL